MEGFLFLEVEFDVHKLIGVDEVGRGPLAGPVVACSVLYHGNKDKFLKDAALFESLGVTDSKKISRVKRSKILDELKIAKLSLNKLTPINGMAGYCSFILKECDHIRIDKINILQASLEAMEKCVLAHLEEKKVKSIWIDGNKIPKKLVPLKAMSIIKGDEKSFAIALASIIAKEFRDNLMLKKSKIYPHYSFETNAGYPTKAHKDALIKYGVTPIHRKTFSGVKELL